MKRSIFAVALGSCVAFSGADAADIQNAARLLVLGQHQTVRPDSQNDNTVRIDQEGQNNSVFVRQHGVGHTANVTQRNDNNSLFIVQFGNGSTVTESQYGGESGLVVVYGH